MIRSSTSCEVAEQAKENELPEIVSSVSGGVLEFVLVLSVEINGEWRGLRVAWSLNEVDKSSIGLVSLSGQRNLQEELCSGLKLSIFLVVSDCESDEL